MTAASSPSQTQQHQSHLRGILLVNLATFTWATNMTLGRSLRDDIGPLTLAASRVFIASVLFSIMLRREAPKSRRVGKDRWLLLAMAITGVVAFAPLLYLGLRYTTAVNATLINGMGPLITGLLATLLIKEPMSKRQVTGAIVSLFGVVILISGGSLALAKSLNGNSGNFIVLGAVTLWSVYSILARRVMHNRSALSATAFSAFLGLPLLLVAAVIELQSFSVNVRPALLLAILYIGVSPTVIGFLSWNAGVRLMGASGAMVFYNTLPLYGTLLGFIFLHESVGLTHLLGGGLIVAGGLWAARSRR